MKLKWIVRSALVALSLVAPAVISEPQPANAAVYCAASGATYSDTGTSSSPELVTSVGDLVQLAANSRGFTSLTGYYKLTSDLDMTECLPLSASIGIAATRPFSGTFDGDNYSITGLSISKGLYGGLFEYTMNATIKNLAIKSASITTSNYGAGVLIGLARATVVSNVHVSGSVQGQYWLGGMVGSVTGGTTNISGSYSLAAVTATNADPRMGGLVGRVTTGATLVATDVYAAPSFTSSTSSNVGGLVGLIEGTSTVTDSFFDSELSGVSDSGNGVPKTTAEMVSFSTFSADWDIVEGWAAWDPTGSPAAIWGICSAVNSGYPYLLWQYTSDPCSGGGAGADSSSTITEESGDPGIFLTLTGQAGRAFEGSDVVFGSYAIAPNSSYQLIVQSISNPSLINQVLATGRVNSGGHLERTIALPRLVAGSYKIILTGTGTRGERLKLTNHVNVDSAGKFTSVSAERLQPVLN